MPLNIWPIVKEFSGDLNRKERGKVVILVTGVDQAESSSADKQNPMARSKD